MNWLLLTGWWLVMFISTAGTVLYLWRVRAPLSALEAKGVALLIPVKGKERGDSAIEALLANCQGQLGAQARLILAVESRDDPAAAAIAALAARDDRITMVIAGIATRRGQKVHNLLAGLAALRPEDRFIVFADADIAPPPDWLAQLLRPLLSGTAEIASGYRWNLPANENLAGRFAAMIDWGVAIAPRSRRWNICWGGSTALTREALDRLDLPRRWSHALSDDLVLTRAARSAGIGVHAPHRVLVPSPVGYGWSALINFGRRQYLLVRVHMPRHWWLAGATLVLPAAACAAALPAALDGEWIAGLTLAAALGLQQLRASLRVAIARRILPPDEAARSAAFMHRDRWLLPAAHLVHLALWLSSAVGRTTIWAGTRYRLRAPGQVEVLGRTGERPKRA